MNDNRSGFIAPRLVLGLAIMVLGTAFLLDNLNVVDVDNVIRLWPLIPAAVGLTMLLQPAGNANRGFGVFLMVAGVWVLLYDFDIIDVSFGDAWPVVLIGFGGWLVWRAVSRPEESFLGPRSPNQADDDPRVSGADTLSAFAFAGHVEKTSVSKEFRGADLTAIMGGCTIDLRGADVGAENAVIDAFAFWGGIEILVPEDWVVTNKVLPLLGGSEDTSRSAPGSTKQLLVRGSAVMGGVGIANHKDD